jgi:hypothetical protein
MYWFVVIVIVLFALSRTKFVIREEIEINASPSAVWAVLLAGEKYREWNSQLGWLGGPAQLGASLHLKLSVEGATPYEFRPEVTALTPEQRFTWLARTGFSGVFDGEHTFILLPISGGKTRLINQEEYRGILSMLMKRLPAMSLAPAGFRKMNQEIKQRAEAA